MASQSPLATLSKRLFLRQRNLDIPMMNTIALLRFLRLQSPRVSLILHVRGLTNRAHWRIVLATSIQAWRRWLSFSPIVHTQPLYGKSSTPSAPRSLRLVAFGVGVRWLLLCQSLGKHHPKLRALVLQIDDAISEIDGNIATTQKVSEGILRGEVQ